MEGKIIEVKDLGEFLVVVSKRGYKLVDMKTFNLSIWSFADEQEMTTVLDIISIRQYRGEK